MIRRYACALAVSSLIVVGLAALPASAGTIVGSISLTKTVGTVPGVCATTSAITVEKGTKVYYCYTVTNNSDVPLGLHTLTDDVLGSLLTDFPYDLTEGSSVSTVAAGLEVSDTPEVTTVNVAEWEACYNLDTAGAAPQWVQPCLVATATAKVTVTETQPTSTIRTATTERIADRVVVRPRFTG